MDVSQLQALADSKLSFLFGLLVFVWAGMTKRVVWGWQLAERDATIAKLEAERDKARAECKEYTDVARDALFNSRKSLSSLETAVAKLKEGGN